jgi:hypothetical protein
MQEENAHYHAIKTYWGSGGTVPSILDLHSVTKEHSQKRYRHVNRNQKKTEDLLN